MFLFIPDLALHVFFKDIIPSFIVDYPWSSRFIAYSRGHNSTYYPYLTLFQLSSGMTLPTEGGHYGPEQNQGS